VFSVIVFFVVLEVVLLVASVYTEDTRGLNITSGRPTHVQCNEDVGYTFIPNKEFEIEAEAWTERPLIPVKINSIGFRDKEHSYEKPPGVSRVIVLGDSFIAAIQVPIEQTIPSLLENKLNSVGQKKFEVFNFGIGGIGTSHEYLISKHYGLKYKPDLVILAFFAGNDIWEDQVKFLQPQLSCHYFFVFNGSGELEQRSFTESELEPSTPFALVLKSFFPRSFSFFMEKIRNNRELYSFLIDRGVVAERSLPSDVYGIEYSPEWKEAWNITEALILKIKEESEMNGAKFVLVSIAQREQVSSDYWQKFLDTYHGMKLDFEKPDRMLEDFSKRNNVTYLHLLPHFQKYVNETGEWPYYQDGHWNDRGNELAADLIYQKLIEDAMIP
jgi:hypothetical protein